MSTALPSPGSDHPGTSTPRTAPPPPKSQRVLACVLCQQRKVKCDRRFPCANCVKHQANCVPATQVRRRRRRFPERELLDRLRQYETLLRQNNVKFDPLHGETAALDKLDKESRDGSYDSDDDQPEPGTVDAASPSTLMKSSESTFEVKNIWHAITQGNKDNDSSHDGCLEVVVKKSWDHLSDNDDHILFGSRKHAVDISTLHPEPAHIFRLWQVYLDNVNPLLKVTHTPSLQKRIVDAAGNVAGITTSLEALMFSIYCMSVTSLSEDECQATFGVPQEELLTRFQFGCQQALLNCGFLRSSDRDCLTALYLYLLSVRSVIDPQSLSSMLGAAIRIAQRMGIHNESCSARHTVLEAEMRRRLWWSLALFDARMGELADHKATILAPTWDCRLPLNVNDTDLRLEMREQPVVQPAVTEALFAVVRCELGEFVRHSRYHLDFTNPILKPIAKDLPGGGNLDALEKMTESQYLQFCDPENPLHFMTIWTTKGYLSKCRLVQHYSRFAKPYITQTDEQRDAAMSHAFGMLECDTRIMISPLTKGYLWFLQLQFPFSAYIHIVQDLRRRPLGKLAEQAWGVMSDNYEARFGSQSLFENSPFTTFSKVVLKAWEALEAAFKQSGEPLTPPKIVMSIKQRLAERTQGSRSPEAEQFGGGKNARDMNDMFMSIPMGFNSPPPLTYGMEGQTGDAAADPKMYQNIPGPTGLNVNVDHLNWPNMDWNPGESYGWGGRPDNQY